MHWVDCCCEQALVQHVLIKTHPIMIVFAVKFAGYFVSCAGCSMHGSASPGADLGGCYKGQSTPPPPLFENNLAHA